MNVPAILKGGFVAGLLINASNFVLYAWVVPGPEYDAGLAMFWFVYAFVLGTLTAYMYAVVRPRWGAGPGSAISAGLMVWLIHDLMPRVGALQMGLGMGIGYHAATIIWAAATMALAGYLAGMVYSEDV